MNYHNITKADMLNGDGLRVVLWVSGCLHNCDKCHNPETHKIDSGIEFDNKALKEIYEELEKDYIKGITFSGGDPLHPLNLETVTEIAKECKEKFPEKDIWLYTGSCWEDILSYEIIDYVDVLADGKFVHELSNCYKNWVGSTNQRVIDVKQTIRNGAIVEHESL